MGNDLADLPRGIRNNNPGNIRISDSDWQGKISPNTDGVYEQFDTPENGLRAIAHILTSYRNRGINTPWLIASTWAPASENNSQEYAQGLADALGIDLNAEVVPANFWLCAKGIVKNESGTNLGIPWYTDAFLKTAVIL